MSGLTNHLATLQQVAASGYLPIQALKGTSSKSLLLSLPSREACLSERHLWLLKQEKDICSMIPGTAGVPGTSRLEGSVHLVQLIKFDGCATGAAG